MESTLNSTEFLHCMERPYSAVMDGVMNLSCRGYSKGLRPQTISSNQILNARVATPEIRKVSSKSSGAYTPEKIGFLIAETVLFKVFWHLLGITKESTEDQYIEQTNCCIKSLNFISNG